MSVSGSHLHLRATQKLPDHRKPFAERQRPRREAETKIMNPNIGQSEPFTGAPLGIQEVGEVGAYLAADNHPWVVVAGEGSQKLHSRGRQLNCPSRPNQM